MNGLKLEPALAPGLSDVVEFVFVEIKATYQCMDCSIAWIQGDECTLYLGQLAISQVFLGGLGYANDRAASDLDVVVVPYRSSQTVQA